MIVRPLTRRQAASKRILDLVVSVIILGAVGWLIPLLALIARLDTRESGIFRQERIGQYGHRFEVMKIRTMRSSIGRYAAVTVRGDVRVTRFGGMLRRIKLDELPQLLNVFRGEMSMVGPRPDVPGYYDCLSDGRRVLLTLKPGITSPASIAFHNEEVLLATTSDPLRYNDEILFPAKVVYNLEYLADWSLVRDLRCMLATVQKTFVVRPGRGQQ